MCLNIFVPYKDYVLRSNYTHPLSSYHASGTILLPRFCHKHIVLLTTSSQTLAMIMLLAFRVLKIVEHVLTVSRLSISTLWLGPIILCFA